MKHSFFKGNRVIGLAGTLLLFLFFYSAAFGQTVTISGTFLNASGGGVSGIPVIVNGNTLSFTDSEGFYSIEVAQGGSYTIAPVFNENVSFSVTTLDLVLISKHILAVSLLDSPYKILAADANASCTLSAFDLVTIRKVILAIDDEFPNNTSWQFYDAAFQFPNSMAPCGAPQIIQLDNIQTDQVDVNWMAVKTGDVQGTTSSVGILDTDDQ